MLGIFMLIARKHCVEQEHIAYAIYIFQTKRNFSQQCFREQSEKKQEDRKEGEIEINLVFELRYKRMRRREDCRRARIIS